MSSGEPNRSLRRVLAAEELSVHNSGSTANVELVMARALAEVEREIRELGAEQKRELLRTLVSELDAPADAGAEKVWLEESQRRYRELAEGKADGVPGPLVFERVRKRIRG